jgi:hypothetical protein
MYSFLPMAPLPLSHPPKRSSRKPFTHHRVPSALPTPGSAAMAWVPLRRKDKSFGSQLGLKMITHHDYEGLGDNKKGAGKRRR